MSRNIVETVLGAVVLIVAIAFVVFAYSTGRGTLGDGYDMTARFDHIDGTQTGAAVEVSGIKVGSIVAQILDPKTFQAIVTLHVDSHIKLPIDTVATITSSGLLGDKYVELIPGSEDKTIAPGGTITNTQSPVSLESLLGQAVFSAQGGGAKAAAPAAGSPQPSAAPGAAGSGGGNATAH